MFVGAARRGCYFTLTTNRPRYPIKVFLSSPETVPRFRVTDTTVTTGHVRRAFAVSTSGPRLPYALASRVLPPQDSILKAQQTCTRAGVALVFVRELPKCRASGAARWLNRHKAIIQLSLRYKTSDHLWFTFFHEAGHLLHGAQGDAFVDGPDLHASTDEAELWANQSAADTLIPPSAYREFVESLDRGRVSRDEVLQFARSIGTDPGVVVGRLQHDGLLPYSHLDDLKMRLQWAE